LPKNWIKVAANKCRGTVKSVNLKKRSYMALNRLRKINTGVDFLGQIEKDRPTLRQKEAVMQRKISLLETS
jgi:hypothetical protein